MKTLRYKDVEVSIVHATPEPGRILKLACDHTMHKVVDPTNDKHASKELLKFLIKAEHTSVFEHCYMTLAVKGISRSLLAQISRQRMASLTSQSQHYQDYSDAPMIIHESIDCQATRDYLENGLNLYAYHRSTGAAKEEARQVLANAAAVNILWTVNARTLLLFFRQRLCMRNVEEMLIFAGAVHEAALSWWPEAFIFTGPPCMGVDTIGECNQGKMRAKQCL